MSNVSVFRVVCCNCPQRFTSGSLYTSSETPYENYFSFETLVGPSELLHRFTDRLNFVEVFYILRGYFNYYVPFR